MDSCEDGLPQYTCINLQYVVICYNKQIGQQNKPIIISLVFQRVIAQNAQNIA